MASFNVLTLCFLFALISGGVMLQVLAADQKNGELVKSSPKRCHVILLQCSTSLCREKCCQKTCASQFSGHNPFGTCTHVPNHDYFICVCNYDC
ncbi:hypothetical protein ABFX02_01G075800 [Erythranthe guttata]